MAANNILVSRFPLVPNAGRLLAADLLDDPNTRYLFDLEQQELLQLRAYDSAADFPAGTDLLAADLERFASHMNADVKRELLSFVEAPMPCAAPLPQTDYVQLRHVVGRWGYRMCSSPTPTARRTSGRACPTPSPRPAPNTPTGFLAGAPLQDLTLAGQEWFERRFGGERPPYLAPVVARLKAHRAAGVEPVFVSGSMLPLLSPLAAELGVLHCLCTTLMVDEQGRLTGAIGQPQTIGSGKADALRQFLGQRGVPAQDCYAYGDDLSDLPMLEAVGRPVAVGANRGLAELAGQRGWGQLAL